LTIAPFQAHPKEYVFVSLRISVGAWKLPYMRVAQS
jgi:hypothetical protein